MQLVASPRARYAAPEIDSSERRRLRPLDTSIAHHPRDLAVVVCSSFGRLDAPRGVVGCTHVHTRPPVRLRPRTQGDRHAGDPRPRARQAERDRDAVHHGARAPAVLRALFRRHIGALRLPDRSAARALPPDQAALRRKAGSAQRASVANARPSSLSSREKHVSSVVAGDATLVHTHAHSPNRTSTRNEPNESEKC